MKKVFFYLMLVFAVLFTACEPTTDPNNNEPGTGNGTGNGNGNGNGIDSATVMTLNPAELTMVAGTQQRIRPVLNPAPTVDYSIEWTSSNPEVASVEGGLVTAVADGEATITAKVEGTEIQATASIVVSNAYDAVEFYDASLWNIHEDENGNVYEYPFKGYYLDEATGDTIWVNDVNEDGKADMVRELYLYVFGKGIYTDDYGLAGESDYLICVNSAAVYDGQYYYCIGGYKFSDDETIYTREHEGRRYMRNGYATYTNFKAESYCKYYENVVAAANNGMEWPATQEEYDQFMAEYGYWLGDRDSYLYYFVNDDEEPYMSFAGLVTGGEGFVWDIANESTGATYLSYMNLELSFLDNTAMGLATELDEETGNLNFKVPFEMAPYYERTIQFGTRPESAPAQNGMMPVLKGRVSEKQMLANRAMNIAIKCVMK